MEFKKKIVLFSFVSVCTFVHHLYIRINYNNINNTLHGLKTRLSKI